MPSVADRLKTISDLAGRGRHEAALAASEEGLRAAPGIPAFGLMRAAMLLELRRFEDAIVAVDLVVDGGFRVAPAFVIRGHALWKIGRKLEAAGAFENVLELAPSDREAHEHLGSLLLSLGDFERGWAEYEHRFTKLRPIKNRTPKWNGEPISGKRMLVVGEQGLGDSLQFVHYVPHLRARGATVMGVAQGSLLDLFRRSDPETDWVAEADATELLDYQVDLMSLPFFMRTRIDTIPPPYPRLVPDPATVASWASTLQPHGFKIGIGWQCSAGARDEAERSVPLAAFAPLAALPGIRLVSLQGVNGLDQFARIPEGMVVERMGDRIEKNPNGISEIAALMMNLDLVVTADTMMAHLAGALGRPAWIALKTPAEWRWLENRSDSPWYPTLRLFRQGGPGEWQGVFEEIRLALVATLARRAAT